LLSLDSEERNTTQIRVTPLIIHDPLENKSTVLTTTKVVSSNLVHGQDVLYATLCDKTDRHDLTELLLKVALNTIALTQFTDQIRF
jgi:hypothetical protein